MIRENGGRLSGLYPDRVLAFIHDGNLYELNTGDTMLDFVFRIQDHRALRTKSIEANGRLAGFETQLEFGDLIRFYCGPDQEWKESWLEKTRSTRAHKRLRIVREAARAEEYRQQGVGLIEERFAPTGIDNPLGVLTEEDKEELVRKYGLQDFEAVLRKIGVHAGSVRQIARGDLKPEHTGTDLIWPDRVVNQIQQRLDANRRGRSETTAELLAKRQLPEEDDGPVKIIGVTGCEYHLGGCCSPQPGVSKIVATASRLRMDFTIHRAECEQFDPNRELACAWKTAA